MTYTNPLNWVAMGDGGDALVAWDGDLNIHVDIERRRTALGTWCVSVKLYEHPRFGSEWTTELRADTYVRHTLLAHGFTAEEIATFEREPELLDAAEPQTLEEVCAAISGTCAAADMFGDRTIDDIARMMFGTYYEDGDTSAERWRGVSPRSKAQWRGRASRLLAVARDEHRGREADDVPVHSHAFGEDCPGTCPAHPHPLAGTVIDPDEDARLVQVLPVRWTLNQFGSRTLTVGPGVVGDLTVVAIETPKYPGAAEGETAIWDLVIRDRTQPEVREIRTGTPAQIARVMRRLYIGRSI